VAAIRSITCVCAPSGTPPCGPERTAARLRTERTGLRAIFAWVVLGCSLGLGETGQEVEDTRASSAGDTPVQPAHLSCALARLLDVDAALSLPASSCALSSGSSPSSLTSHASPAAPTHSPTADAFLSLRASLQSAVQAFQTLQAQATTSDGVTTTTQPDTAAASIVQRLATYILEDARKAMALIDGESKVHG